MAQTFNPDNVMLSDSIGKEIANDAFTQEFEEGLQRQSNIVRLGQRVNMTDKIERKSAGVGELSDAYFVGEGEKIGTAKVEGTDYLLEAKKIGVILPVSEEFLTYTWSQYFNEVVPLIVDKFNKKLDGAAFLGLHGDPFSNSESTGNVLTAARNAGNVVEGDLTFENIEEIEYATGRTPNAFLGHRNVERGLRGVVDSVSEERIFTRPETPTGVGSLDGLPYVNLQLAEGEEYPEGTLITGNFNSLRYGVPNGTSLRLKVDDSATLSTIQNDGPDSGDVHMFEQDMQALRAIYEIAVAVPRGEDFAALESSPTV